MTLAARDAAEFLLLAAIWGASFLFMRVAAPEFGPIPLMLLRCSIAALVLLLVLMISGRASGLISHAGSLAIVGIMNSAIPFVLLGYATLTLSAGITSIMNSLAPLWSALIAFAWFGDRLTRWQLLGLCLGCVGVMILVAGAEAHGPAGALVAADMTTNVAADAASDSTSGSTSGRIAGVAAGTAESGGLALAVLAAILATLAYGVAANFARHRLRGVDPWVVATGSQVSASVALLLPGLWWWPATDRVAPDTWWIVIALGVVSTALAYLLFFRLIASVGATRTIAVTFVIPVFGVFWGWWFLGERISVLSLVGAIVIVLGTALAVGLLRPSSEPAASRR